MGIGAYVSGMTSKWLDISPWAAMPLGAVVAAGIGMLLGYPFTRLRALYYAMGSLFFGVAIVNIISVGGVWTGGYNGLSGIPAIFISEVSYYYLFFGIALITLIALYRFEFSRIGLNLKAIAQSHLVASSVGINERWYRVLAVGVGCFFVGLVGAAYAHFNSVLSPSSFDLSSTLWMTMYVLIGGISSFAGPIIGTPILIFIPEFFRDLKMYAPYISVGILVIIVFLMPRGLVNVYYVAEARLKEWRKRRTAVSTLGN
jgi:branched-chain amino acid transport system permease protein